MRGKMTEEEIKSENNGGRAEQAPAAADDSGAVTAESTAANPQNPNMKWYIIHTYSGFERKVKESIESRVRAYPELEHGLAGC